jgi:hypothetical protein
MKVESLRLLLIASLCIKIVDIGQEELLEEFFLVHKQVSWNMVKIGSKLAVPSCLSYKTFSKQAW